MQDHARKLDDRYQHKRCCICTRLVSGGFNLILTDDTVAIASRFFRTEPQHILHHRKLGQCCYDRFRSWLSCLDKQSEPPPHARTLEELRRDSHRTGRPPKKTRGVTRKGSPRRKTATQVKIVENAGPHSSSSSSAQAQHKSGFVVKRVAGITTFTPVTTHPSDRDARESSGDVPHSPTAMTASTRFSASLVCHHDPPGYP